MQMDLALLFRQPRDKNPEAFAKRPLLPNLLVRLKF
jgi:hypothetical protein